MNQREVVWLRISGTFGILAPIVAFAFISFAIAYSPQFIWTENALSDLGVQEGITPILFNSGLIIVGILALVFASGLFVFLERTMLGRIGAFLFVLDMLALTAIGVFPENVKPTHFQVSVTLFVLYPLSMLIIAAAFVLTNKVRMGLITLATGAAAAVVWIAFFVTGFVHGVAIPEAISVASAAAWAIVTGFQMLKKART